MDLRAALNSNGQKLFTRAQPHSQGCNTTASHLCTLAARRRVDVARGWRRHC
jgi:hypothetical protein